MGGLVVRCRAGEGTLDRAFSEVEESDRNMKQPMMYTVLFESQLFFRGILSYCKGYCSWVGCEAEHSTSRGSKEERIRIHLRVWANIQSRGYKE